MENFKLTIVAKSIHTGKRVNFKFNSQAEYEDFLKNLAHSYVFISGKRTDKPVNTRGGTRPNAGRPSKERTTTINFRIPIEDKAALKKLPISKLFKEWYKTLI